MKEMEIMKKIKRLTDLELKNNGNVACSDISSANVSCVKLCQ